MLDNTVYCKKLWLSSYKCNKRIIFEYFCFRYLIMKRLYLHMAPLEFTSIQIPSETVSGLLTLRVDAQKNCLNNVVISTLIAGSLS